MEPPSSAELLNSLWSQIDLRESECCGCGKPLSADCALARTFSLRTQGARKGQHALSVDIPELNDTIFIYHRHIECLFKSTRYIAVSHVWNRDVAELQYKRDLASVAVDDIARAVRELPARVYLGLVSGIHGYFELWHDYISVPQWQPELKSRIILEIPRIFHQATLTVAYLSDVDSQSVAAMRAERGVERRCRGVSDICNAKWFSRVWTAMEFVESGTFRTMLSDYTLVDDDPVHQPLIQEMWEVWSKEQRMQTDPLALERMVEMGKNLVPWQLGPLNLVKDLNMGRIRTPFGIAHELLSRRCVTIRRDFFHAILGILKTGLTEPELIADEHQAMSQVAKSCIQLGDFSPLLTIPDSTLTDTSNEQVRSYGYLDLTTFALGGEQKPPTFTDIRFCAQGNLHMQAENIGQVQCIKRVKWSCLEPLNVLSTLIRLVLESTGPDVDRFVRTLGARLYGQIPDRIFERLTAERKRGQLQYRLENLLSSKAEYSDEAVLWVADALGLSNTALGSPMSVSTPMDFLTAHGGTIHLGDHGAVISVCCKRCHEGFLLRAALLKRDADVTGATAYRVPGLKFEFSHEGGAGFLIGRENNEIVGRLVWGISTCRCLKLEAVEVVLPALSLPRPNTFNYGQENKDVGGWVPINSTARIATPRVDNN